MPRRRHSRTIVAVFSLLAVSLGGLAVSVVAFGQGTETLSDYTNTTPTTTPLSDYTSPPVTAPSSPTPTTPKPETTTGASGPPSRNPTPTRTNGSTPPARSPGPVVPRTPTHSGPNQLAFTGGEPLIIGGLGALLMLAGFGLHRRRRTVRPPLA